jgi:hypothetical protein
VGIIQWMEQLQKGQGSLVRVREEPVRWVSSKRSPVRSSVLAVDVQRILPHRMCHCYVRLYAPIGLGRAGTSATPATTLC